MMDDANKIRRKVEKEIFVEGRFGRSGSDKDRLASCKNTSASVSAPLR